MPEYIDIELNKKLFKNIEEEALTNTFGALENCFVTESNGISRFPGLVEFCNLGGNSDIHISRFGNDMIAVGTDGRTFRINTAGNFTLIEGAPVLGGSRTSFARTRNGLMMAAGGQIIKFDGTKNEVLSKNAPLSRFIGYLDGYVLAVEKESGRFQYTELNKFDVWPGLNTIGVDGSPDDINALLITPFNEILFSGHESMEQYERNVGSTVPFYRRWSSGDGVIEPDTLCFTDNASWGLNSKNEFVRLSGQTSQSISDDIQNEIGYRYGLSEFGTLSGAWARPLNIKGQKFIVFQSPEATNSYGTKGFTAVFDIRRGFWFEIFGWDASLGAPTLWQGRSIYNIWGRDYVGGQGKIYQLSSKIGNNDGQIQRAYIRTAHFDTLGTMRIERVRMTIKRGVGTNDFDPKIMFRSNPDKKGFGSFQYRTLGTSGADNMIIEFGAQGIADTWQFEISLTDDCEFELRRLQVDVTKVAR